MKIKIFSLITLSAFVRATGTMGSSARAQDGSLGTGVHVCILGVGLPLEHQISSSFSARATASILNYNEGATGSGKTFIACALAHQACRQKRPVLYRRVTELVSALARARDRGTHERLMRRLAKVALLALEARISHWVSIAANDRGTSPQEVLTTQELLGCSRSIGPFRPCGRNPEIGRVSGNFFCPGFPSALRAPGKPGQLRGGDHQASTQVQELWTSLSGQPAPFGTCGQAVDAAGASPTALTTLACFSPTGTTGQPQHRFFQYSDSSGLTAGKKGAPAAPEPRERTTGLPYTAVLKSGKGSLTLVSGWPSASLPASKKEDRTQASVRERLAR